MMSDLISRKEAIDALKKYEELESNNFTDTSPISMMTVATIANCIEEIVNLPSAKPECMAMVWKPAKGRPAYEKGICNCGYVLSVLQRDFVYCPNCGARLEWGE